MGATTSTEIQDPLRGIVEVDSMRDVPSVQDNSSQEQLKPFEVTCIIDSIENVLSGNGPINQYDAVEILRDMHTLSGFDEYAAVIYKRISTSLGSGRNVIDSIISGEETSHGEKLLNIIRYHKPSIENYVDKMNSKE